MSKTGITKRMEQTEKLRADMRSCLISSSSVNWCLANARGPAFTFICSFFDLEARRRGESRQANMIRQAGFPSIKSIDDYDFSQVKFPPSLTKEDLVGLNFIKDHHSLVMHGICGSGKTMLSICLGMLACTNGYKVRFYTLSQLAMRLKEAAEDGRIESMLGQLSKLDLLIIDEWGYTKVDSTCAGYIYRVIADSYERKSLIITTNLPFSDWGRIFADEQLAAAIIDRIVHYGHSIDTGRKDWRLANSPMNRSEFVKKEA